MATIEDRRKAPISLELDLAANDRTHAMIDRPNGLFIITEQKIMRIRSDDLVDPKATESNAPWEQSVHLPYGSRDPIVARTIIQTKLLTEAFFGANSQSSVQLAYIAWEVMNSLISLRHMREQLNAEIDRCIAEVQADLPRFTEGRAPAPLPLVPYYDIEFRLYVNEIRRLLSKVSEVFAAMTEHEGEKGHFHKALAWVRQNHGPDSALARMLTDDLKWITLWIDIRISIEHPKRSCYLETLNFSLEPNRKIRLPKWRLVHEKYPSLEKPQDFTKSTELVEQNLLKFFEDLQVALLPARRIGEYTMTYALVDEPMRNEAVPMRYAFGLVPASSHSSAD
ncbi:MAG: hypothetical protein ACOH2L_10900 [Devosia sp.]